MEFWLDEGQQELQQTVARFCDDRFTQNAVTSRAHQPITVYPSEVEAALRGVDGVRMAHVTDIPAGPSQPRRRPSGRRPRRHRASGRRGRAAVRERLSSSKVPTTGRTTAVPADFPILVSGTVEEGTLLALLQAKGEEVP